MIGADESSDEEATAVALGWQPRPWWAWASGLSVLGIVALGWSAVLLSQATLGTSLRSRSCDGEVLVAFVALVLAALALALAMVAVRLHHDGALLGFELTAPLLAAPIPLLALLVTLPGVAGCRAARSLDDLPLLGDALVGSSGIAVAGAAAALLGAALATVATVSWLAPTGPFDDSPPSIVEQRMLEADAFQAERAAERFHGVDPLE